MFHPFDHISPDHRRRYFWLLLALTIGIMAVFSITGAPLNTPAAPQGIVSYELAGTAARAQEMMDSWDNPARLAAAFGLGLDYLFMPVYSTALALACLMAAGVLRRVKWPLGGWGAALAWGLWAAALLDAIENLALTVELLGKVADPWPQIAWFCATVKFALIVIGLVYAFFGLAARVAAKPA